MSFDKLILVTGASGYIASHVVQQLLQAGYRVRGTARAGKVELLRDFWKDAEGFEAVRIDDIATSDFTDALKDVSAVIHVACPLAGKEDPAIIIKVAVEGTMNVLRQATAKGVTKFVVTSSWGTLVKLGGMDAYTGMTISEHNWGKASISDLLAPGCDALSVYRGAKILAEQAVWEFNKEHLELDIATILPPRVYGPPILPLGPSSISTVSVVYQLITGEPGGPIPVQPVPSHVDVRDVARAHISALELPPRPAGMDPQERRFLVAHPDALTWEPFVKYLHESRPALRDRLPSLEKVPEPPGPVSKCDTTRAREVLGMTEYMDWRKTVDDTIDALLEAERAGLIAPADAGSVAWAVRRA